MTTLLETKAATITYLVKYKSNGVKPKPEHNRVPVKPGVGGTFKAEEGDDDGARQDAEAAVEKVKSYFNDNKTTRTIVNTEGMLGEAKEVTTNDHLEIVDVWIERYIDGSLDRDWGKECPEQESEPPMAKSSTSSKGKKSAKRVTTEPEESETPPEPETSDEE